MFLEKEKKEFLDNKKILFIVEKPSQAKSIEELDIYKTLLLDNEINFHYAHCTVSYYTYKYPNNLKYKDLPFINDLDYKLNIESYNKKYKLNNQRETQYSLAQNNLNKEFFLSYNTIIFATDQNGSGCYGAYMELEQVLGNRFESFFENIYSINTNKIDNYTLSNELFQVLKNIEYKNKRVNEFYNFVNQGKIKKYFDYNYQINCNIFIKELYKYVFIDDFKDNKEFEETYDNYGFTKYMLLTMISYFKYLEKNNKEIICENQLHRYLDRYKGSGKYDSYIGLGSVASRGQIINNLIKLKIIDKINGNNYCSFNNKVKTFIELLNKKMYDPDLPFRIEEWQNLDFDLVKEKINTYIKDIFLKQKIKNKHLQK